LQEELNEGAPEAGKRAAARLPSTISPHAARASAGGNPLAREGGARGSRPPQRRPTGLGLGRKTERFTGKLLAQRQTRR